MKKIILEVLIEDVDYAEEIILKTEDTQYVTVEARELTFDSCKQVDEFAGEIKEMIKGLK